MQMSGSRHDTSLDGDFRGRRSRPASRSVRTPRRHKTAREHTGGVLNTAATCTDDDAHQNVSSEDNLDDADNSMLFSTLDRSRSRINRLIDVVGKPFARRRSKSVDALLSRRRPATESIPPDVLLTSSTDDPVSFSGHTSGSTSMTTLAHFANGQIPGVVGIRNHGNTCFMNSVIQCLSNTEFFAEYFVTNEFKSAVQAAQKARRVCAVTKQLNRLLSSLWTCEYSYQISAAFRAVVGKNAVQYHGTDQNDAQEFLHWLLDHVNEELYGTINADNQALNSVNCKVCFNNTIFSFLYNDFCY